MKPWWECLWWWPICTLLTNSNEINSWPFLSDKFRGCYYIPFCIWQNESCSRHFVSFTFLIHCRYFRNLFRKFRKSKCRMTCDTNSLVTRSYWWSFSSWTMGKETRKHGNSNESKPSFNCCQSWRSQVWNQHLYVLTFLKWKSRKWFQGIAKQKKARIIKSFIL